MSQNLPPEFLARLNAVTAKRAKTVIQHILQHGFVSTEDLKNLYGYSHPPRGARDVKEQGIPLVTIKVKGSDGRSIAAYQFADPNDVRGDSHVGRRAFPAKFKKKLLETYGYKCAVCVATFTAQQLQIDHRVPYEVGGDTSTDLDVADFMLLCRQCNRIKSWSCEHCKNWLDFHKPQLCETCYWAHPEKYKHIALQDVRRLDVAWVGAETKSYDSIVKLAERAKMTVPDFAKAVLEKANKESQRPGKKD